MKYSIFSVIGIEIEYMIVSRESLNILPVADELIKSIAGTYTQEVEHDEISINNELTLHVVELKTTHPRETPNQLDKAFQQEIQLINQALTPFDACLLPTGAHPWMNPANGVKLWPHGSRQIYDTYHKIFDCRGHGWSNLQSMHVNLPFANDEEFVRLHSAIRLLMPLIPALASSTPFIEGKRGNSLSMRMKYYVNNQAKIPSIGGRLIPEFVASQAEYHEKILAPMYRDIAPFDLDQTLQEEWLNSRGAIARFDRNAIEIRIIDSQECAKADIAIAGAIQSVLRYLTQETEFYLTKPLSSDTLRRYFDAVVEKGFSVEFDQPILSQLGLSNKSLSVRGVWEALLNRCIQGLDQEYQTVLENRLSQGNLAERLIKAVGKPINSEQLKRVYGYLAQCLNDNMVFDYEKMVNHV